MRIAFLCKRQYMGKDVVVDRYARLYEIPHQLACMGHDVLGCCFSYHGLEEGAWAHEVAGNGRLQWISSSAGRLMLPELVSYPFALLRKLKDFRPDVIIGASDIPHVALARWLATRLRVPYMADLYDNFEGFGQARIPGFVSMLRNAVTKAPLVTTTSSPLRDLVIDEYGAKGTVISMPSSVDLKVFSPGDRAAARARLGLPADAQLMGTAGGLYRDKGIAPLYDAWASLQESHPNLHLVLAGPTKPDMPPPQGDRVHYLGNVSHGQVADLFRALDVGVISILDTTFGRFCFPQKAYEMLACHLPVVVTDIGEMGSMFAQLPQVRFPANDAQALAGAIADQLEHPVTYTTAIRDWSTLISDLEPHLKRLVHAPTYEA